ncbi:hypothetical protein PTSG_10077 [Salpingoeca rosetta]|uniref:GH16 domain-containing protein n=1 Tax=Salpingoeca rosetta (strain ATCC 50818 / BSB-021) TaxID=946362 RepID=F2UPF1_SALR5|nr:uncharacterized protein PTSG_10077 [Salpingoeca rosetta]EGD79506.1 hypothetical protein PTSG_10077 [Salpingoeca rosetta]|eukprot:XP_004988987.1 hypothetical protein PTSG_10077 [Salpingoeca rosetta]
MAAYRFLLLIVALLWLPLHAGGSSSGNSSSVMFAGYEWAVRENATPQGPGPNIFSRDNVRVDAQGRLLLSLRKVNATTQAASAAVVPETKASSQPAHNYTCAEVSLTRPLGYGTYSFEVAKDVHALGQGDPFIVLGMFLYKDDTHEIDIEVAQWGNPDPSAANGDFVVQPPTADTARYWRLSATRHAVFRFTYAASHVAFLVQDADTGAMLTQWNCTASSKIPSKHSDMLVHINLWLFRGTTLKLTQDVVTVPFSNFTFSPL